jgi:AraC-like DNA-binding protein
LVSDDPAISSKAANGREVARGMSQRLRTTGGARAMRLIELPNSSVAEHAHDWPILSLYSIGSCTRFFEGQAAFISGPCAVLHPRGEFHSNRVGAAGFEQIDIEFDPAWLRLPNSSALQRVRHWRGGGIGRAARRLTELWASGAATEASLRRATTAFIEMASATQTVREPAWLPSVLARIDREPAPTATALAQGLGLHPGWVAQAYRHATGEGIQETVMRRRVERAALLLRSSAEPAAGIAAEAGFCDQSHMIRCFRQVLRRTPGKVRAEV